MRTKIEMFVFWALIGVIFELFSCYSDSFTIVATCTDGLLNQYETDVDCGGPYCDPCDIGQICLLNRDCESDKCNLVEEICSHNSCNDGHKNGDETDIDCGGLDCNFCELGNRCRDDWDCYSKYCDDFSQTCKIKPCMDGNKTGSETDIDCGGPDCDPCEDSKRCLENGDCTSGYCNQITGVCEQIKDKFCDKGRVLWGLCWYLGEQGQSCTETCRTHGGVFPEIANHIGTQEQGGSLQKCQELFNTFGYLEIVEDGQRESIDGKGLGCILWVFEDGSIRLYWHYAPPFNPDDSIGPARPMCSCRN